MELSDPEAANSENQGYPEFSSAHRQYGSLKNVSQPRTMIEDTQFQKAGYRAEIDGLRAIAAMAVLVFHFFPDRLPSGYLGVDLFFVISGYVITNQLQKNLTDNSFSFAEFYKRRIRRILPLTFVVTTVTLFAAAFILLRPDFEAASKSAFATSTFWANIFFWRDGGYFGGADKLKPLLHMWSLAVEEQFYILFPALLWLLVAKFRIGPRLLIAALLGLTLLSFAAYIALIQIGGATPAFFLMPTRAWQFGVGAAIALAVGYGYARKSAAMPAVALVAMLFFLWLPGFDLVSQLGITLGVGAYLLLSGNANVSDRALSSPVMRYLGLRSFSIYLWHWPIVAFMSYAFVGEIPLIWKAGGVVLTFTLSEASYRLVEKPFRYTFSLKGAVGLIAASAAAMIATHLYATGSAKDDLEGRLASQIQTNFRCAISDFVPYGASRACILKQGGPTQNVAIIGNSHAQMYAPAILSQYSDSDKGVTLIPLNSCTPTTSVNVSAGCAKSARTNLDALLADEAIGTVYIGTTYGHEEVVTPDGKPVKDSDESEFAASLIELVDALEGNGKEVRLIGPIAVPGYDFASEMSRKLRFGWVTAKTAQQAFIVPRREHEKKFSNTIQTLVNRLNRSFIRVHNYLCDADHCRFADAGGSYFADSNHLSEYGVAKVSRAFEETN